jgi:hypothetical protein
MSLTLIIQAVLAALRFPGEVIALVKLLSKSPAERQQEIMLQVNAWMDESSSSERPHWEGRK